MSNDALYNLLDGCQKENKELQLRVDFLEQELAKKNYEFAQLEKDFNQLLTNHTMIKSKL